MAKVSVKDVYAAAKVLFFAETETVDETYAAANALFVASYAEANALFVDDDTYEVPA